MTVSKNSMQLPWILSESVLISLVFEESLFKISVFICSSLFYYLLGAHRGSRDFPGGIEICSFRMDNRSAAGQSGVSSPQHRRQGTKLLAADILLLENSVNNVTAVSLADVWLGGRTVPGCFPCWPDCGPQYGGKVADLPLTKQERTSFQ